MQSQPSRAKWLHGRVCASAHVAPAHDPAHAAFGCTQTPESQEVFEPCTEEEQCASELHAMHAFGVAPMSHCAALAEVHPALLVHSSPTSGATHVPPSQVDMPPATFAHCVLESHATQTVGVAETSHFALVASEQPASLEHSSETTGGGAGTGEGGGGGLGPSLHVKTGEPYELAQAVPEP